MTGSLRSRASSVTERAWLLLFRSGWGAVRRLPAPAAYRLFDTIAVVSARRGGKDADRMRSNYAKVRPDLDEAALDALVLAGFRSYMRYWCDAFRLPDRSVEELVAAVRPVDVEPLRERLHGGGGAVAFLGHLGNWDTVGAWATTQLAPVTTVAERLKPEELYEAFLAYREQLGMTILPLTGGDGVFLSLVRTVRDGGFVPLLADRDLTDKGLEVDFCGHRARMAAGPAALAVATKAPLFPVTVHYEADPDRPGPASYRTVLTIHPAAPTVEGTRQEQIHAMTQYCADQIATVVREHTEDWHMMQRVFLDDLDPRRHAGTHTTPDAASQGPTQEGER